LPAVYLEGFSSALVGTLELYSLYERARLKVTFRYLSLCLRALTKASNEAYFKD
jgi:hypothetical protein